MWLLLSRRPLGAVSLRLSVVTHIPCRICLRVQKRGFLLRSDDNLASHTFIRAAMDTWSKLLHVVRTEGVGLIPHGQPIGPLG